MIGTRRLAGPALCALLAAGTAAAGGVACDGQPVEVEAPQAHMVRDVCDGAIAALAFLGAYGLEARRPIRVGVVAHPLDSRGHPIYGRYDVRTDRVEVMSLQAVLDGSARPEIYRQPFDAIHYRGVIAHEVAHAVVQQNRRVESLSQSAQEYLAHAAQLAVLPRDRRDAIIREAGVGPWEIDDVISDIYMAMAPSRFAVKSYLHLTGHGDPARFVAILLSARWRYVYVR